MDALLEPPTNFALDLPTLDFSAARWYRVHQGRFDPLYFDREPSYRFNAPDREFGVLYMSEAPEGAFAEALLGGRSRPPVLTESRLQERALSAFDWSPLKLADFAGYGLASLGLDGRIASADAYELCRRWAAWVHRHPRCVDGICYLARNAPSHRSVALFDRAGHPTLTTLLEPSFLTKPGAPSAWGLRMVSTFGVALVPG